MGDQEQLQGQSWSAWLQINSTSVALFAIVILSFIATVGLMHEDSISDKYVTWLEGFCGGAMTSLAVSMKTATTKKEV